MKFKKMTQFSEQNLNHQQLKKAVKRAVMNYNTTRIHNSLPGTITPVGFEKQLVSLNCQEKNLGLMYAG